MGGGRLDGRLDELDGSMQKEAMRATAAEAELQRSLRAQEAVHASAQMAVQGQLQELLVSQSKRADDVAGEVRTEIEALRGVQEEALRTEEARASAAEEQLGAAVANLTGRIDRCASTE